MIDRAPLRGEVWLARLDKVRPVVVLTRDPMGRFLTRVIAVPVTSRVRGLETEVPVGPDDGLEVGSVAALDNLRQVQRSQLVKRIGRARPATMNAICQALAVAVDCQ